MILRAFEKPFSFLTGSPIYKGIFCYRRRLRYTSPNAGKPLPPPKLLNGKIGKLRNELHILQTTLDLKLLQLQRQQKKQKAAEQEGQNTQQAQKKQAQFKRMLPNMTKQLGIMTGVALLFFFSGMLLDSNMRMPDMNEQEFLNQLNQRRVKKVTVIREMVSGEWKTYIMYSIDGHQRKVSVQDMQRVLAILDAFPLVPVEFEHRLSSEAKSTLPGKLKAGFEICFSLLIIYILVRGTRAMSSVLSSVTKQKYKPTAPTMSKIKFDDVAGMKQAKQQISQFVEFLKMPEKFTELGAKIPRGALLTGPPGTGKTLLAKACAGQAGVPFFYMSGSEFVEKYVGVGASRVRSLFESASKKAPSIIFIDEIDAIGKKRSVGPRGNEERDNTLNQLLVNMDGFGTNSQIVVLAATNRKDMLDSALLRPGRFDRIIEVTLPDREGRYEILLVHLEKVKFDPSLTKQQIAERLAALTPNFSGADLSNICNQAAIIAARGNKTCIQMSDFDKATQRVLAGLQKRNNLSTQQRKIISLHQSARAIAAWFLQGADPILKITIIPRSKKAFGHTQFLHNQSVLNSKQDLLDRICCALASRVIEQIRLKDVTDSTQQDLKKAQMIAHKIVTQYGMSETISNIGFPQHEIIKKHYSGELEVQIDNEVSRIIKEESDRIRELLNTHMDKLNKLCDELIQKETLNHDDIKGILGERPFQPKSNYKAYLDLTKQQKKEDQKQQKPDS